MAAQLDIGSTQPVAHLFMLLQTAATLQPWNCCWLMAAECASTASH